MSIFKDLVKNLGLTNITQSKRSMLLFLKTTQKKKKKKQNIR